MNFPTEREVCGPCNKFLNIGQAILECEICDIAIHTKCFNLANFCNKNDLWVCNTCAENIIPRYNPFHESKCNENYDKFYEDDDIHEVNCGLQAISSVLDSCKSYTPSELQQSFKKIAQTSPSVSSNSQTTLAASSLFVNIDGLSTNFDKFLIELKRHDTEFMVIGLAETNTDEPLKDLYPIPNYTSFYQPTQDGKRKGTGVALYTHNSLNVDVLEKFCYTTPDIETIFIKTTNTPNPLVYGALYRPPNGQIKKNFHYPTRHT